MKTLLIALSHPDDEIGCAGTIAAHADAGWRAVRVFLTKGEMTFTPSPTSIARASAGRTARG
jgi:LmbE family N-acetylglucosaminyl deacetylase